MVNLKMHQQQFQDSLINGSLELTSLLETKPDVDIEERLAIYQDAYYLRLLGVLTGDFAKVKDFLGEELFEQLASAYIHTYPSQSFSLYAFGQYFSQFIEAESQGDSALAVAAELAKFEWVLVQTLITGNAERLQADALAKVTPEAWLKMRFKLHPSTYLLPFYYNVPAIWKALNQDLQPPEAEYFSQPIYYLIWRFHRMPYYRKLDQQEAFVFEAIQKNAEFETICEGLCQWLPAEDVGQCAGSILHKGFSDGVFTGVEFEI